MLSFSRTRYALLALAGFSFAEATFFPLPPDILQIPMTLERPDRAWWFATVNTVASVLGGLAGYAIGFAFISVAHVLFSPEGIQRVGSWFDNFWVLTAGSIVVHPYKLFTIAAGFFHVNIPAFLAASLIGRGLRFFLVAALLRRYGEPVRHLIERYFNLLTILLGVVVIGAFVLARMH